MADLENLFTALPIWFQILLTQMSLILVPAGAAFFLLYVWKRNPLRLRKVQPAFPHAEHIRREVRYALLSALIFSLNGLAIYIFMGLGWTLIYDDIAAYGWLYLAFSVVATIVLHDAYFYWTHRLMHHRRLFKLFHRVHHESLSPSPWAAYAFAPAEAVVQTSFLTILVFMMPIHPTVVYAFMVHMIVRNVIGHSGFELFPKGVVAHPVLGLLTTTTHHDLHHSAGHANYGLYFTWWDRLVGTEHPEYRQTFERVWLRRAVPTTPLEASNGTVTRAAGRAVRETNG